jgi:DeoR family transcriptional regulator, fructose operon transcriptional repressor
MIPHQRREKILGEFRRKKTCTVTELSKLLGVSEITIHRDLASMENNGSIRRVHGGATISDPPPGEEPKAEQRVQIRLGIQVEEKTAIARRAVQLIRDETSIFVDHSSSSIYLAREIRNRTYKNLVIVTNSVKILNELEGVSSINLISTGGNLQHQWSALGGSIALDFLSRLNFDQIFISCGGISVERGLMTSFPFVVEILKRTSMVAQEINLLADSSKFTKVGTFSIMPVTSMTRIITDGKLDPATGDQYKKLGIEVMAEEK